MVEDHLPDEICGVKITLSSEAFSNETFRGKIENGELEKVISKSRGYLSLGRNCQEKYQNVAYIDSPKNAVLLARKLVDLPYIRNIQIGKSLQAQEGYIEVKTPKPLRNKKNEDRYYERMSRLMIKRERRNTKNAR